MRALILTTCFFVSTALSQTIVDQQFLNEQNVSWTSTNIDFSSPIGQSFTPSLSSIDFIRIRLTDASSNSSGATYKINLYSGIGMKGALLGTTESISFSEGFGASDNTQGEIAQFNFSQPIVLSPGALYTLHVEHVSGDNFFLCGDISSASTYSAGSAIEDGFALSMGDYWFQEGVGAVPEPSSISLLLAAVLLSAYKLKDRTRRCS